MAKKTNRNASRPAPAPSAASPTAVAQPAQPERLAQRRDERSRGRQAAAARRRRQKKIQSIALLAVAVIAVAAIGYFLFRELTKVEPGDKISDLGGGHVDQSVTVSDYNSNPPTSGQHWGTTAAWGVHDEPVPNEQQVHNLEHGGIVIQYDPSLPADQIEQLREVANQCSVKFLLAPREGMDTKIGLAAWNRILKLDSVDRAAIDEFVNAWINKGPENIQSESDILESCDI